MVYDACKFACLHANMFCSLSRRFILCCFVTQISQMTQIFLATADVGCTYHYFQNIMDCIILCHIFRLRRYFCGVWGITSPIICGICVTYSLSHRFHRFPQILGLIKCVAPNFFCNFSPKSLAGLKIKP